MERAVSEMGVAVIHGAFSTFLAVLVLSNANSYIFRVFFKQFFGICVFGASHGLVFLPAMLGLAGPPPSISHAHASTVKSSTAAGDAVADPKLEVQSAHTTNSTCNATIAA